LWTGDRGLAEELAQETLIRVCQRWERVRELESPGAWAHHVALNLARSEGRKRRVVRRAQARLATRVTLVGPDLSDVLAVREAVEALPERQRVALVLRYYLDLSVDEAAAAMDCPANTVKTLTRRALRQLADSGLLETRDVSDAC
jgi:RNA polymerase sigma factor (sigma-70 family)